ncbi:MAG: hypothetical protein ACE5LS_03680 [Thermoplasmata archaeon]
MARWTIGPGIGVLVAGMITIGLSLYFGFAVPFELLIIGGVIAVAGLVLLGVGGALRFVAALLLGVGILGIALVVGSRLVGGGMASNLTGYVIFWGLLWGVPSLALGLILLAVSFIPGPTTPGAEAE